MYFYESLIQKHAFELFLFSKPVNKVDVAFASPRSNTSNDSLISSISQSPNKEHMMESWMENVRFVSPTKEQQADKTYNSMDNNPHFMPSPSKELHFEKNRNSNTTVENPHQTGSPTKVVENPRPAQYTFVHADPSQTTAAYYINMASHTDACADDEVPDQLNSQHTPPISTPRTNILSHMAKNKISWVESTLQNRVLTAQRASPIHVKGRNPNTETPYEKNQRNKDISTKGVRDGRRFDLLPISKYLAQSRRVGFGSNQERLPLVRISSVQRIPVFQNYQRYYFYGHVNQRQKTPQTFFAQKDLFKPRESRSQPTRGEAAFVEIREQLPNLYKKQYNAPVVNMGRVQQMLGKRETATLTLPTVT